ncbi:MAG: hypothetical protein Udaeo_13510 [Candidatus Udaeobacter sp.]|nr:MAG: hypothetical protein Udaeo_13510 [Candidatus Udaeobacter sp.]
MFVTPALGDVVKAIDCSGDFSPVVLQRTDIDKDGDMRAVGPLNQHFRVTSLRYLAAHHLGHGTLVVGHKTAVRSEHFERAAKPLIGVPQCWLASPKFGGMAVEVPNHAGGVNGIDGHGTQIEQGAIALLRLADRFFPSLPFGKIDIALNDRFQFRLGMLED